MPYRKAEAAHRVTSALELLGWALWWHRGQAAPGCGQARAWKLWREENGSGKRSGKERGVVSSVCGKLEQGERLEGRVWRGVVHKPIPLCTRLQCIPN